MKNIIIAIDGHAGCGKSSTAKIVARTIGYTYIDSGAMYRAVTLYFLRNGINIHDANAVAKALESVDISFGKDQATGLQSTFLNGENVEQQIRGLEVSQAVSEISTISAVRRSMVAKQQKLGAGRGIVMDGRDIGTVVFPDAEVKFFMTATDAVRAHRRLKEMKAKNESAEFSEVLNNLRERDRIDSSRLDSPLKKATDAHVIDTSHITFEQQVEQVLKIIDLSK